MNNKEVTRRKFMAVLGGAGAVTVIGAAAMMQPSKVNAVGPTSTPLPPGIASVQGSWVGTLTARGTTKGLATFTSNGGLLTTNQKDSDPRQPQGGGHGVWTQDGHHIVTRLFKFVHDENGALTSIIEELTALEIDDTGNVLTGTGDYKLLSLDGKVLQSGSGNFSAKRITVTGSLEFI